MSTDLIRPEDRATSGMVLADRMYNAEHRAALARYLGVSPENPALFPMLAVCAAWGLDPFAGQVWLLKQKGRDAEGAERWRPAAGRDGYLAIANRQTDFRGVQGDVVREQDHFSLHWDTLENGMRPVVEHSYEQGPADEGEQRKVRGAVVGGWAIVFRQGRLPVYYFAPWAEHMRDPQKSAWSFKSAMILKAAQSMALRLTYSITGLVPVDEMNVGLPETGVLEQAPPERPWADDDLAWGEDEIGERLREAVQASWVSGSQEWSRARLGLLLQGDREALLAEVEATLLPEEVDGEPVA